MSKSSDAAIDALNADSTGHPTPWRSIPWGEQLDILDARGDSFLTVNAAGNRENGIPSGDSSSLARLIIGAPALRDALGNLLGTLGEEHEQEQAHDEEDGTCAYCNAQNLLNSLA